ncbi:MAG: hypothetical protein V4857_28670 [Pseudomonadota bacterium]
MWWWVSAFFALLALGDHAAASLASAFAMSPAAAEDVIVKLLVVAFLGAATCIGLHIKEEIRAGYTKFADRLGMDLEKDVSTTFLKQADTAPWRSWARASDFKVAEVMRSRSRTPEFWIFDMHYREQACGCKFATIVTFFVVTMNDTAPAQVQEWMVPKGFKAVRSQGYLYVYRAKSWFGAGDRLGIAAIPATLRHAFSIASAVESLGESMAASLKERASKIAEAASGLNQFRPPLLVLAWILLAVAVKITNILFLDLLLIQGAVACAVGGSVWRRDRNPTPVLFLWLLSLAMFWTPSLAVVLLGLAALEAMFGMRNLAAGLHLALLIGVGLTAYGIKHDNALIALAGVPLSILLGLIQDLAARSKRTRRNEKGWLEWQVRSGL